MTTTTYQDILLDPKTFVPPLYEKEIKTILLETIQSFLDKKTDLHTVIKISNIITQYSPLHFSNTVKSVLDEIRSLYIIDDVFAHMLEELLETDI